MIPRITRSHKAMFGLTVLSTIVHVAAVAACMTGGGVYVIQVHSPDSGITWTVAAMALILIVTRDWITLASVITVGLVAFAALWWDSIEV